MWGENGIRRMQGEYNQNNRHGEFLEWNQYGILTSSRQYRFNKLHGDSTLWYDSGKVRLESYFLYGHIIDAQGWFPDGNPCPFSRVTNGKGLVLRYDENFSNEGTPAGAYYKVPLEKWMIGNLSLSLILWLLMTSRAFMYLVYLLWWN